jgi:hypothetical protein
VEVGEEDVADLKAKFLGVGQVVLDIANSTGIIVDPQCPSSTVSES